GHQAAPARPGPILAQPAPAQPEQERRGGPARNCPTGGPRAGGDGGAGGARGPGGVGPGGPRAPPREGGPRGPPAPAPRGPRAPVPSSPRPYGSYFDEIADRLADSLDSGGPGFPEAIEQVVVENGELNMYVRREHLVTVAKMLRDEPSLAFELCLGVSGVHYP